MREGVARKDPEGTSRSAHREGSILQLDSACSCEVLCFISPLIALTQKGAYLTCSSVSRSYGADSVTVDLDAETLQENPPEMEVENQR
jgi:hypothetical protein